MTRDLSAIAAALRDVPGVSAAAVDPDPEGGVGALRLVLATGADGLEVADTVSRLLHDHFAADVGADRVHVVDALPPDAPGTDAPPPPRAPGLPAQRSGRPAIVRTEITTAGFETRATVVLHAGSTVASGDAWAAASGTGVHRAVAQATMRSVERLVGDQVRLDLDHLDVSAPGGHRTVLVGLSLVSSRGAERLAGTSVVREDEARAVVRAVLDALNRRLEPLLS